MSSVSRSRSRSRSPLDRKIRSDRFSYRNAPYRRESRRGFSRDNLCKNCKRPGHYARECPNVAVCHNCDLPGHWPGPLAFRFWITIYAGCYVRDVMNSSSIDDFSSL